MTYQKRYLVCKDSGVSWIGEVPEHWEVKRLRHVARFMNSNVDKKAYEDQQPVKLCNYTDVYYNEFITMNLTFMDATASDAEVEKFSLRRGDVIMTKDSEDPSDIGIPALVAEEMSGVVCGYHLTIVRASDLDTARFLHRLIQAHPTKAHFFVESPGITRYGLNQDAIGDIPICLPPTAERRALVEWIDRETARIDALIAKKTRFIELLKEKRQALITHAITKGLDPTVRMKDSGVSWIGEVPEHWEVKRLRHVARFMNSNVDKKAYEDQQPVKLCNYTDVYYNEFITMNLTFMDATASDAEVEKFSLRRGDVIMTKDSEDPSDIGIPALVAEEMSGVVCGYHLTIVRASDLDTARFLHRLIQAHPTKAHFFVESPGITRYGLNQDAIGDIPICLPPTAERRALVEWIDRETARIDALIVKAKHSIALLKERRSASITAAVTGQIDLREAA